MQLQLHLIATILCNALSLVFVSLFDCLMASSKGGRFMHVVESWGCLHFFLRISLDAVKISGENCLFAV